MTADSGKRFTCIIPKEDETTSTTSTPSDITSTESSEQGTITSNTDETNIASNANANNNDGDNQGIDNDEVILNDEDLSVLDSDLAALYEEDEEEEEEEDEEEQEPEKTTEELLQEVDTLENRDRYIQELIVQASNSAKVTNKKKQKKIKKPHSPCYYSREGYWNYELCLYDKIMQFHGNKNKRNPNIALGEFSGYIDISRILMNDESYSYLYLKDIYGIKLFENTDKNFVHLLYTKGEAKREALVTIQCSKAYGKKTKDGIIKISEPKIHHYHFTFIYKQVCEYEGWLKREYNIYDDDYYDEYEEVMEGNTFIDDTSYDTSSIQLLAKKNIDPNSDDISLLLSPLLDLAEENRCLLLKQGWWTVEFCYGEFIRQIHLEAKKQKNKKGQIVTSLTEWDIKQEHYIGKWDDKKEITKNSFTIHKNANDPARTYASILYDNGDTCDLTKEPRKTEIQFRCGLNIEHSELIKSREDPSCEYIAQVETPLLCGHPDFKIPSAPSYEIVCYPFDEKEFVDDASSMKQAADIQSESDSILRMITTVARAKYENEKKVDNKQEKEDDEQDVELIDTESISNDNEIVNKPKEKVEL